MDLSGVDPNEKTLLSLQDEVIAQVEKLNAELKNNPPNYDTIVTLADESSEMIEKSIAQVEDLAKELGNSRIVTDTKKVLTSAQMLAGKVKELARDLKQLKTDLEQLAGDAKAEIEAKINEAGKLLDGYKLRLADIKDRFDELRLLIFGEGMTAEQSAAEAAAASKRAEATI